MESSAPVEHGCELLAQQKQKNTDTDRFASQLKKKKKSRQKKTAIDVPTLFRLWTSALTQETIAKKLNISRGTLCALAARHKLPKKENGNLGRAREKNPTPEELAAWMEETRNKWSDQEREERFCGPKRQAWNVPGYEYSGVGSSFSG